MCYTPIYITRTYCTSAKKLVSYLHHYRVPTTIELEFASSFAIFNKLCHWSIIKLIIRTQPQLPKKVQTAGDLFRSMYTFSKSRTLKNDNKKRKQMSKRGMKPMSWRLWNQPRRIIKTTWLSKCKEGRYCVAILIKWWLTTRAAKTEARIRIARVARATSTTTRPKSYL